MNDRELMRMAIDKAREGIDGGQTPFGALIVREGRILSIAHNQVWADTDITAHAEVTAIRLACAAVGDVDLSGSVIYSTCEPCPMCFSAIHWAGISKIVCGARIEDAKQTGFRELTISNDDMARLGGAEILIERDFMREEARKLFAYWLKRGQSGTY